MTFKLWNKDAEKRTKETAEEFWKKAEKIVAENEEIYSLAWLCIEMQTYKDFFSYIVEKFPCFASYKKVIDQYIENRVHKWAITWKIKETTSIFTLKNNHWWVDKKEIDLNNNITVTEDDLYDEEIPW